MIFNKKPQIWQDLKIPVDNFYGFLENKNYSLLTVKNKKVRVKHQKEFSEGFKMLFYEYCYKLNDTQLYDSFLLDIDINLILGKINSVTSVLDLYEKSENVGVLELLNDLDISFDKNKKIEPQVKKAIFKVKMLRNKYKLLVLKVKKGNKSKLNVSKTALKLEKSLELSYEIDTSKCQMEKWVTMLNLSKTKNNG